MSPHCDLSTETDITTERTADMAKLILLINGMSEEREYLKYLSLIEALNWLCYHGYAEADLYVISSDNVTTEPFSRYFQSEHGIFIQEDRYESVKCNWRKEFVMITSNKRTGAFIVEHKIRPPDMPQEAATIILDHIHDAWLERNRYIYISRGKAWKMHSGIGYRTLLGEIFPKIKVGHSYQIFQEELSFHVKHMYVCYKI